MQIRRPIISGLVALTGVLLCIGMVAAQESTAPLPFATNTPQAALPTLAGFATNTPQPSLESLLPETTFARYALRLWDELTLTQILLSQVQQLRPGDDDRKMAIRLLQYELQKRFPGAPRDATIRQGLISAMLAAPRGSVDMRTAIRPYIESALNQIHPSFLGVSSFDFNGFNITLMPANLNGDDTLDAVVQTRYPALVNDPAEIRYQDFVMAQFDADGVYHVLESNPAFPAAPLDDIQSINLERLGDLNQDGLDEIALSTKGNDINQQLSIFGWRNNGIVDLVEPGRVLQFGTIADWPTRGNAFTITEYRTESPSWNCLGQRDVTWEWRFNFFRPPDTVGDFTFQNRLACLLYGAEPLFGQPLDEAINSIQNILPLAGSEDDAAVQRAAMTVAMLRVLNGNVSEALDQVNGLQTGAQPGTWLADQTAAFLAAANASNSTPLKLCAALEEASSYGACDVDQVLTRLFKDKPLKRTEPVESQLANLGIDVLTTQTVSAVGKMDRQVVHFFLAGDHWWAFAPIQKDTYTAEEIDPPPGSVLANPAPPVVDAPESAFRALLTDADPTTTLNILDNVIRENAGSALASSGYFLQAISYDLIGDRSNARRTYFDLWSTDPQSLWGQLAAAHLEQR
ncbi:MAG: hypothetical protein ABI690_04430 [Chloroflexota bacterium]